uniref:Secreted protein n=1 Tax=Knipowitschia caucasica TaxID=637954 RepID=A0AAV2LI15_KNICA
MSWRVRAVPGHGHPAIHNIPPFWACLVSSIFTVPSAALFKSQSGCSRAPHMPCPRWPFSLCLSRSSTPHLQPCVASDIQACHCSDTLVCLLTATAYGEGWHCTDVH